MSSQRWLQRQFRDPFVADAKAQGFRSRAAFKLVEIDDKFGLLTPGKRVLDLGAAPGGWTQIAVARVGEAGTSAIYAVDILEMEPIGGAATAKLDIDDHKSVAALRKLMGEPVDVVLSDMAPPSTGHRTTDALREAALGESGLATAIDFLRPGGAFVVKVMRNGQEAAFIAEVKKHFETVRTFKPKASRPDSAEIYVVATGFRTSTR